jgi:hypothetical protein
LGTFLSCNKKVPRLPGRDPAFQLRGKAQQSALAIRQTIQNYCWIPAFAGMTTPKVGAGDTAIPVVPVHSYRLNSVDIHKGYRHRILR